MDSLGAKYGNDDRQLLETPTKWMDNSQKACDMLLAMFERIAALPETRAANVVRYFLTLSSTDESQVVASIPAPATYHVVKTDVLNLRAGPGANYPVVAKLPTGATGITLRDGHTANGTTMWQEVSVNGYKGWVNEIYIEVEPEIQPQSQADTAQQAQSQAEDFIVAAKDGPDGLILWVQERDSGKLLLNTVMNSTVLNGDLNTGRIAALAVTSQNSGSEYANRIRRFYDPKGRP